MTAIGLKSSESTIADDDLTFSDPLRLFLQSTGYPVIEVLAKRLVLAAVKDKSLQWSGFHDKIINLTSTLMHK